MIISLILLERLRNLLSAVIVVVAAFSQWGFGAGLINIDDDDDDVDEPLSDPILIL